MLLKYSNGWGHLIMSLAAMGMGMWLVNAGQPGWGWALISMVVTAWFLPGAAKQTAHEIKQSIETQPLTLAQLQQLLATAPAPEPRAQVADHPQEKQ